MKYSLRLMRIGGIDIGVNYTWIFIFALVTWSLAQGYFPQAYPGWGTATYWTTSVVAALLLFVSVLLHELAHSFVARARGMKVDSITLFIFGGVSNLEEEPEKPKIEFTMSIVGPLASLVLAGIFWGIFQLLGNRENPLAAIISYLALINLILAAFNLLPGFPLDGGRVLRSILWSTTGSLVKATNIAATVGQIVGWGLIAWGFFQLLTGNFIGGIWIAFIGWFLSSAADANRREITTREQLRNLRIEMAMNRNVTTISPDTIVAELVSNIFQRQHGRAVPVAQDGKILGIVTVTDVSKIAQDKWGMTPVRQIMNSTPLHTVSPEEDLSTALKLLAKNDINQLLVLRDGELVGLLSRANILNHLQLSHELGLRPK